MKAKFRAVYSSNFKEVWKEYEDLKKSLRGKARERFADLARACFAPGATDGIACLKKAASDAALGAGYIAVYSPYKAGLSTDYRIAWTKPEMLVGKGLLREAALREYKALLSRCIRGDLLGQPDTVSCYREAAKRVGLGAAYAGVYETEVEVI